MRRHLQKFLPIVLIALMVQVLAPIGACWAAAVAAADPLASVEICRDSRAASGQEGNQSGDHRSHDGACAICCSLQTGASVDTPQPIAFATPFRQTESVVWHDEALGLSASRTGSNSQARAPPQAV